MTFSLVPAAYVFLVRPGEGPEVLLQRRANTGYMDGHWVAGAAGHVEPGEWAGAAAVRELAEELGIRAAVEDLQPLTVMQRRRGEVAIEQRVDWFFALDRWEGEPRILEPDKCSGLGWYPLEALPDPMPAYERWVLTRHLRGDLPVFSRDLGVGGPG